MHNNLFLDIETIPCQREEVKSAIYARPTFAVASGIGEILPAANLKDPAKIAESIAQRTAAAEKDLIAHNTAQLALADRAWRETALDGWTGHIAVIGYAINDNPVDSLKCLDVLVKSVKCITSDAPPSKAIYDSKIDTYDEVDGIYRFLDRIGNDAWPIVIGHNVRRFDVVFLWQRCIVLGIEPPPWLARARYASRYDNNHINDTMEMTGNTLNKPFGPSLNHVCDALGIPTKGASGNIDGSMVWDEIAAGRIDRVADYCRWDVRRARSVWRACRGMKPLAIDLPQAEMAA